METNPPTLPSRFVILWHEMPASSPRPSHFDLMLEDGASLRTWALESQPVAGQLVYGTELAPHRLDYLDYEGPVSGGRGTVRRCDDGRFLWMLRTPDQIRIRCEGRQLSGDWELVFNASDQRWSFGIARDDSANR